MSILGQLFGKKAVALTSSIGNVVDMLSTSDEEKLRAKNELTAIVSNSLETLALAQKEVLLAEMKGSWLQRSWRPIVMLLFAFIVAYSKFIAPAFGLPNTVLEADFWNLLELGMGGFVIGRSIEKITDKVTQNMDLSLIKKKNRKTA